MNFSNRDRTEDQFQIAPMIDIVFILLIFFVATYATAQEEKLLDIQLPEAQAAHDRARSLQEVVVNLDREGGVYVNRRKLSVSELERRLERLMEFAREAGGPAAEPGVIIRAHAECAHKHVVAIMDACARTQVRRVFFSSEPREASDAP